MQFVESEPITKLERVSNVRVSFHEKLDLSDVVSGKNAFIVGGMICLIKEMQVENLNPGFLMGTVAAYGIGLALCFEMPKPDKTSSANPPSIIG